MALEIEGVKNIFPHSKTFETGGGKERPGQATIVVSLDGTGDTDDIQSGIELLPDKGGIIYIKEGIYTISEKIELTKDNVIIQGIGKASKIQSTSAVRMLELNGANKVLIRDIFFDGDGGSGKATYGIYLIESDNVIIKNCLISNMTNDGILVDTNSGDCLIDGCEIEGNSDNGINNSGDRIIITNSVINANNDIGIKIDSATNGKIIGNTIRTNTDEGIFVNFTPDLIIKANTIESNGSGSTGSGIYLDSSGRTIIIGNTCRTNQGYGIEIDADSDNNILIGNVCLNNVTGQISDGGSDNLPNGARGTNNLALDDLNIIA